MSPRQGHVLHCGALVSIMGLIVLCEDFQVCSCVHGGDLPEGGDRGGHAHLSWTSQLLPCQGQLKV